MLYNYGQNEGKKKKKPHRFPSPKKDKRKKRNTLFIIFTGPVPCTRAS